MEPDLPLAVMLWIYPYDITVVDLWWGTYLKNILFQMQIPLDTWLLIIMLTFKFFLYSFITFIRFIVLTKAFRYKTSSVIL